MTADLPVVRTAHGKDAFRGTARLSSPGIGTD
jgi:hypothetical protein